MTTRPRRSVLFMPAVNERAIAKIPSLPVDTVILDLEDSVHPERKEDARNSLGDTLNSLQAGYREVLVRINAPDTPWWQDDLAALAECPVDGVVVPKVDSLSGLDAVVRVNQGLQCADVAIWIMLESPAAVLAAPALCLYGDPLAGVIVGTADLSKSMKLPYQPDRTGLLTSLSQCVLAARAAGVAVIDGVYMDIHDTAGLESECVQGRALGFDGKTLIHPAQLETANREFSPSVAEITRARELIAAWEAAGQRVNTDGVIVHDNKLVEYLHIEQAKDLVNYADLLTERQ